MKTIEELITFLNECRSGHYYCEDNWYSCPKAEDGCADTTKGTKCNCGADSLNKDLDEAIDFIKTLKTCNHLSHTDGVCDYCGEKLNDN